MGHRARGLGGKGLGASLGLGGLLVLISVSLARSVWGFGGLGGSVGYWF